MSVEMSGDHKSAAKIGSKRSYTGFLIFGIVFDLHRTRDTNCTNGYGLVVQAPLLIKGLPMRPLACLAIFASMVFAEYRSSPCWFMIARMSLEKKANESATDQAFRKELQRRRDEEQKLRFKVIEELKKDVKGEFETMKQLSDVDKANREWLKAEVAKSGWPTQSRIGFDGADAAWLLVQHADADRGFQKQCLKLLEVAAKMNEARPSHVAYLTDRVLCAEGKKQLYGTQFTQTAGRWEPKPIEDVANIDKRRAEAGLGTLADYRMQMEKAYGKGR